MNFLYLYYSIVIIPIQMLPSLKICSICVTVTSIRLMICHTHKKKNVFQEKAALKELHQCLKSGGKRGPVGLANATGTCGSGS